LAHNKGWALVDLGRYEDVISACDQAIALNPKYASARNNKGVALQRLHRDDEALAAYNRAGALTPDAIQMLSNRSRLLLALKRWEKAARDLRHTSSAFCPEM
jgi:Flp pilus assembly protein TadD